MIGACLKSLENKVYHIEKSLLVVEFRMIQFKSTSKDSVKQTQQRTKRTLEEKTDGYI